MRDPTCHTLSPPPPVSGLYPLSEFYAAIGAVLPEASLVAPAQIPEPCRSLLVHESDMTSTLERFYGDKLRVEVLGRRTVGSDYFREVALALERGGRRVEFGAIKMSLDLFSIDARLEILREEQPLGRILAAFGMTFASRPAAYWRLASDAFIGRALKLPGPRVLYGRRNTLVDAWERSLAEIVEILPPD